MARSVGQRGALGQHKAVSATSCQAWRGCLDELARYGKCMKLNFEAK